MEGEEMLQMLVALEVETRFTGFMLRDARYRLIVGDGNAMQLW